MRAPVAENTALILGAGFSRAVSGHMPLTDELGNACLSLVDPGRNLHSDKFDGGRFETWLSELADEQPYLSTQENLENQALFLRFSDAIATVLGECVQRVLSEAWPSWLPEFIKVAHFTKSTVLTFNYDTLIECAVNSRLIFEWNSQEPVFWAELTSDVPNWPAGQMRYGATRSNTLRLLKLHGSLNWYWVPGDMTGMSIARRMLPGSYEEPVPYNDDDRRRELPGRVPFVVPPAAAKSTYYRNPITREIWRQASMSLESADHIVIVGYSLPLTDLTFASLFRRAVGGSRSRITLVDPYPKAISERLNNLGIDSGRVTVVGAGESNPVAVFTDSWVRSVGVLAARRAEGSPTPGEPLMAVWRPGKYSAITSLSSDRDGLLLVADDPRAELPVVSGYNDQLEQMPTLSQVREAMSADEPIRIVMADGSVQTVVDIDSANFAVNHSLWNVFYPSGPM